MYVCLSSAVKRVTYFSILLHFPGKWRRKHFLPPLAATSQGDHVSESASKVSVASYKPTATSGRATGSPLQTSLNEHNKHAVDTVVFVQSWTRNSRVSSCATFVSKARSDLGRDHGEEVVKVVRL